MKADISAYGYFMLMHVKFEKKDFVYVLGGWNCKVIFQYMFYDPADVMQAIVSDSWIHKYFPISDE